MNTIKFISFLISISFTLSSSLIFAVEPTTFPDTQDKKQQPQTYPGTIWKPGKTNLKSQQDSKKIIRKGQKETGVLVEPTMAE